MEPAGSTFFYCLAAFLLLAPLYKAGNRPVALLVLELAAIALIVVVLIQRRSVPDLPRLVAIAIALLLVYPLVQLIPLPGWLWRELPGHAPYAAVLDRFAATGGIGPWHAISVVPSATEYGWLALLPPLACLLGVLHLSKEDVARLLLAMAIFAGAEGLLGLLQVGPGGGGMLYLGNEEPGQYVAIGTFVNRNHLAAMLAMALPAIVGLLVFSMRPGRHRRHHQAKPVASEAVARRVLLFASAVLIMLCLLYTRSRAGIASGLVGLASAAIVLVRARAASVGTSRTKVASYVVACLVVVSVIIAFAIGVAPILSGLDAERLQSSADFRWAIYVGTLRSAFEFLPFGSGLSTFADVFPRFQVVDPGGIIDYAHNDYLQAFMELGLVAPVIVVLLLFAYVLRMIELLLAEGGRSFTLLQLGAGLGMLPMMLHSFFDFALHMPSNAMWFAALAGVMFHERAGSREFVAGERRGKHAAAARGAEAADAPPPVQEAAGGPRTPA